MRTRTTFWNDFTIADAFGESAVKDTFNRAFEEWKGNTVYVTELVLTLNWKIWEHYDEKRFALAVVYNDLWEIASQWCMDNLTGAELDYYFKVTD